MRRPCTEAKGAPPPSAARLEAGKAGRQPDESLERQWERAIAEFGGLLRLTQLLGRRADEAYRFATIPDRFQSMEEVRQGLRQAGLESSNLIVAVDFTGSNHVTGRASFGGRCLHDVSGPPNPYQQVMEVVGRTLEPFDDDRVIPAFGFGDVTTTDKSCFPFRNDRPCHGLQEVLDCYRDVARAVDLAGPTNFAPVIDRAIDIVQGCGNQYHILLIVGDGQVNSEPETVDAIVRASNHPLSIVMVGVGDGPWEQMRRFDDELPQRRFDNFQFVDFGQLQRDIVALKQRCRLPGLSEFI